jgi:hypothetical protein
MHNNAIYNFTIKICNSNIFWLFKNHPQGENIDQICIKHGWIMNKQMNKSY